MKPQALRRHFPFSDIRQLLHLTGLLVLLVLSPICSAQPVNNPAYHKMTLEGWTVYVEKSLVANNDPRVYRALKILSHKLQELKTLLPQPQLNQLINVPIWLSSNNGDTAEFYFFEQRVFRNDLNPELMDGVEFQNIDIFIKMIQFNPMLVLHELAHAYHKMHFDTIDKPIMRAYKNAEQKKLYLNVMYLNREKMKQAYALTNAFEYFAELTETYFGTNDFYPYTRDELKKYDPVGYRMIEAIWK